jgi:hypothetical protein
MRLAQRQPRSNAGRERILAKVIETIAD